MWVYVQNILIPLQISEAQVNGRPRGNLSDLYPRWVGTRELLLRGRDPYSPEVTREIQEGYYGRALDASRESDPKDRSAFAYPVYVVFLLAPTIRLPFESVRAVFLWLLIAVVAASVLLWIRLLKWRLAGWVQASLVILALGSISAVQGLKLQQLSLFVAGLIAMAIALLAAERPSFSGVLLALTTIKPHLAWLLIFWIVIWSSADWRRRYRCGLAFLVTMTVLLLGSEVLLPRWISEFWLAAKEYRAYTNSASVLDRLLGTPWGAIIGLIAGVASVMVCWRNRDAEAGSERFAWMTALVLALTVVVAPTADPYNQVLLLPAMLVLVRNRSAIWRAGRAGQFLLGVTALLVVWPWIASVILSFALVILPPVIVKEAEILPFGTVLLIPVGVLSVMLACARTLSFPSAFSAKQA
jgi:hypothetical protein